MAADQAKADAAARAAEAQSQILQTQLAAEQAKVRKLEQEAQLIAAKIKTESVNQQVSAAGVDYDKEKLRIEKASTLNAIEQGEHSRTMLNRKMDIDERLVKQKDKPNGSAEKGLRSNNLKK